MLMGATASSPRLRPETLQQTLRAMAQRHGATVSQVALNWLTRKDAHVIPIAGATSAGHTRENADALSWELSDDEFASIDQVSAPASARVPATSRTD
jgi:pyridoxine 4-dehydrogenase